MHLDSNKKHLRNDILHSIIIKWSMFIRIFSILSLLIFFHSSNNLFARFFIQSHSCTQNFPQFLFFDFYFAKKTVFCSKLLHKKSTDFSPLPSSPRLIFIVRSVDRAFINLPTNLQLILFSDIIFCCCNFWN